MKEFVLVKHTKCVWRLEPRTKANIYAVIDVEDLDAIDRQLLGSKASFEGIAEVVENGLPATKFSHIGLRRLASDRYDLFSPPAESRGLPTGTLLSHSEAEFLAATIRAHFKAQVQGEALL